MEKRWWEVFLFFFYLYLFRKVSVRACRMYKYKEMIQKKLRSTLATFTPVFTSATAVWCSGRVAIPAPLFSLTMLSVFCGRSIWLYLSNISESTSTLRFLYQGIICVIMETWRQERPFTYSGQMMQSGGWRKQLLFILRLIWGDVGGLGRRGL